MLYQFRLERDFRASLHAIMPWLYASGKTGKKLQFDSFVLTRPQPKQQFRSLSDYLSEKT